LVTRAASSDNHGNNNNNNNNHHRNYEDALAHNQRRTDVRIFLTQRAIQSFMFLLVSTRDPHTVNWFEKTYQCNNLNSYHGTGAFNLTKWTSWDSILADMIRQPPDVVIVSARRRGRGHGGWSRNNPYLEERFVEFEIDIDPPSLVSRILSVRQQIADEWILDLDTMVASNDQILESYYDNAANDRDSEECIAYNDNGECIRPEDLREKLDHFSASPPRRRGAFDRTAMMMLRNAIAFDERASSPYRKGNFDLLVLLATQESVHRLLREYQEMGDKRKVSFEWLRNFYVERVEKFFDGSQDYGRADDFLEELLLTSPSMKTAGNKVELVDPLRIAEDIIRTRSEVGLDWKKIIASTPQDHLTLQKDLLTARMGGFCQPSSFASAPSTMESTGSFE